MVRGDPGLESPFRNFYGRLLHLRLTGDPTATTLMCHPSTMGPGHPRLPYLLLQNATSLLGSLNLSDANQNDLPVYWRPVPKDFMSLDAIICTL